MICAKRPRLTVAGLPRQKSVRLKTFFVMKSEVKNHDLSKSMSSKINGF